MGGEGLAIFPFFYLPAGDLPIPGFIDMSCN